MEIHHYPLKFFSSNDANIQHSILLLLNSGHSLCGLAKIISEHWNSFSLHICADGGSNTLYDSIPDRDKYIPEYIVGDMDSIRPEVLDYYKRKGSEIIIESDTINTDFMKSLLHIQSLYSDQSKNREIFVFNISWGRMDQILGNVHTLFCTNETLYLISEESITFVLKPGRHVIHVGSGLEEGHCGLIPIGEPCKTCSTSGLKWNLDNQGMEIGGLISTSNLLDDKDVIVNCSNDLLFTMSHKLCNIK